MLKTEWIVGLKRVSRVGMLVGLVLAGQMLQAQEDRVNALISMALGDFNSTVPETLRQREVGYVRYVLLGREQWQQLLDLDKQAYPDQAAKALAVQELISGFMPVSFVTLRDNTTYWSSMARKQEIKFADYFSGIKGLLKGEEFQMTLDEMRRELKYLEFPLDHSGGAIACRRDGTTFSIGNASLYAKENDGSWYCMYQYVNPVNGKTERKLIFGSDDYSPNWRALRRIVFGLQVPKMNESTGKVFPSDYKYDPFTRQALVPVEWNGPVHISK